MTDSGRASLLSLPNELLLELLCGHPSSLYSERREKGLTMEWFTWNIKKTSKYTVPWLEEHHPIALPLSQTCRRLRALMLPCIWEEVGVSTLEELARVRDDLRMFPERGELIVRLEWSWLLKHPAYEDEEYRSQHRVFERTDPTFEPLEKLLKPPFRWPKQPMTTKEECIGAITEVVCRAVNLSTLLWVSPYLPMQMQVIDFLANKKIPLERFQVDLGTVQDLKPDPAPYWRFAHRLTHLSVDFRALRRDLWEPSDMERWRAYDDDLTGLEAYGKELFQQRQQKAREAGQRSLSAKDRKRDLAYTIADEREAAAAYKILMVACQGGLRSLQIAPPWVLSTPELAPLWVQLEQFHIVIERPLQFSPSYYAYVKGLAHLGVDAFRHKPGDFDWYLSDTEWHKAAAAIRTALYHAARHRTNAGPLTVKDVQAVADQPPEYPLSFFYPCFRDAGVAQGMAEMWESLVQRGESERIVCQCTECR